MGNILSTFAILFFVCSISLFVLLLFRDEIVDGKNGTNIILIAVIGVTMLITCAYLLNVGEDLSSVIAERKSIPYQMDEEDIREYKESESRYLYRGFQAITIIGLLYLNGLQIMWISKAKVIHNSLKNKPKWNLKELSNSINNIKKPM